MCLYIKEGCKPEIAKKDIVCYKRVDDHITYWKPRIYTYNTKYSYSYNKILTAESCSNGKIHSIQHLEMEMFMDYSKINEGFHARYIGKSSLLKTCIIPKGTEYCLGKDDDIVAVNMIVFRTMLGYYWYKIKKLWQE